MTWLQQLLLAISAMQAVSAPVQAGACEDIRHVAREDVHHQPQPQVEASGGFTIAPDQLDVPVVVDVLRGKGRRGPVSGETLIGIATLDGAATGEQGVTLQGPAVNEAAPVYLGPDCQPLEPRAEPAHGE